MIEATLAAFELHNFIHYGGSPMKSIKTIIVFSLVIFFSNIGWGLDQQNSIFQPAQKPQDIEYVNCAKACTDDDMKCINLCQTKWGSGTGSSKAECTEAVKEIKDTIEKLNKICSKASSPDANCKEFVTTCQEKMEDNESADWTGPFAAAAMSGATQGGVQMNGIFNEETVKGCPQLGDNDYWTQKKEYEQGLDEAEDAIREQQKEAQEERKKIDKENKEILEAVKQAQRDLEKNKKLIKDDMRNQLNNLMEDQGKARAAIYQHEMNKLKLQSEMSNIDIKFAADMLKTSKNQSDKTCMLQVYKLKKDLDQMSSSRSGSISGAVSSGSSKKAMLENEYYDCMQAYQQERRNLEQKRIEGYQQLKKAYEQEEENIKNANDQIQRATAQLAEVQAQAQQEDLAEQKRVIDEMMKAQQQMQEMQTNKSQMMINTTLQQVSNHKKLNRINTGLATMTNQKTNEAATGLSEAADDLSGYLDSHCSKDFKKSCSNPNLTKLCNKEGKKGSIQHLLETTGASK